MTIINNEIKPKFDAIIEFRFGTGHFIKALLKNNNFDLTLFNLFRALSLVFKASPRDEIPFGESLENYDALHAWASERCTPLVREITFENAEELTEEGLPFLILFHKPDDLDSIKTFEREVQRQLASHKGSFYIYDRRPKSNLNIKPSLTSTLT